MTMIQIVHDFLLVIFFIQIVSGNDLQDQGQIFEQFDGLESELHSLRSEIRRIKPLEAVVEDLRKEVTSLKSEVRVLSQENLSLNERLRISEVNFHGVKNDNLKKGAERKRLIGNDPLSSLDTSVTAFTAVMTRKFDYHIGPLHVFIYDHVESNFGRAYNNNTGIFTAPKSGIFAFLWTIAAEGTNTGSGPYGEIDTELIVNSSIRGRVHTDTEVYGDDDEATGFVIVHLSRGDVVYIRNEYPSQGNLQKNIQGGWTFSGWQIA